MSHTITCNRPKKTCNEEPRKSATEDRILIQFVDVVAVKGPDSDEAQRMLESYSELSEDFGVVLAIARCVNAKKRKAENVELPGGTA